MRVFVDVDVQHDFCEPRGALYVPGSPNDLYRALVRHAVARGAPIVGSVDSHAFDAWEFASSGREGPGGERPGFPDHCVKGTPGWLKVSGTLPPRFRFVPNVPGASAEDLSAELASGAANGLYFEKEVYSLFVNPNAEAILAALAARAGGPLDVIVFGVATDYCVKAAALGLRARGYATTVLTDAVRGISEQGTRAALTAMADAGCALRACAELGVEGA
ncbi:MAG: isochorismatase family protein [Polyangiaceae bacterium]|nr:isochorismatase family protein [Polyangiaceae bacterium]